MNVKQTVRRGTSAAGANACARNIDGTPTHRREVAHRRDLYRIDGRGLWEVPCAPAWRWSVAGPHW
eukprot:8635340-Alexandrium_andersonii.AAC.1